MIVYRTSFTVSKEHGSATLDELMAYIEESDKMLTYLKYGYARIDQLKSLVGQLILKSEAVNPDASAETSSCPHCGTTELLCGHPNHCTSDKNPANEKIWFGCKFKGKKIGSIGKFYDFNHQLKAGSKEQAKDLLYELFDHITNLTIVEI